MPNTQHSKPTKEILEDIFDNEGNLSKKILLTKNSKERKVLFEELCNKGEFKKVKALYPYIKDNSIHWSNLIADTIDNDKHDLVSFLISKNKCLHTNTVLLYKATISEKVNMVKIILPYCDPEGYVDVDANHHTSATLRGYTLFQASAKGYDSIIKVLITKVFMIKEIQESFEVACSHGNFNTVKLLLPYCDPRFDNNKGLSCACMNDNPALIEFLMSVSDKDKFHTSLFNSAVSNKKTAMDLLFDVSDIIKVKEELENKKLQGEGVAYFMQKFDAFDTKTKLEQEILSADRKSQPKKKI